MKSLHIHIEHFQSFISLIRQNVTLYSEIVQKFDVLKPIDNCFLAVNSSCCARKAAVQRDCMTLMKNFVLNEESREFFLFFKRAYDFEQLVFMERGATILIL